MAVDTRIHCFNDHFPGQPGLACCPLDSQSPVILILSILTGQAEILCIYMVLCTVPLTLTTIPRGFEAEVFTGWMPFLSPNKQRQCTEGITPTANTKTIHKYKKTIKTYHEAHILCQMMHAPVAFHPLMTLLSSF